MRLQNLLFENIGQIYSFRCLKDMPFCFIPIFFISLAFGEKADNHTGGWGGGEGGVVKESIPVH